MDISRQPVIIFANLTHFCFLPSVIIYLFRSTTHFRAEYAYQKNRHTCGVYSFDVLDVLPYIKEHFEGFMKVFRGESLKLGSRYIFQKQGELYS